MIGIVSLVEHLHGRTSDYGIHVSGLMVEVALLFSVGVKDGIYRYRLLFLEQSQDGLHGSVAHAKFLHKEGDLYRSFFSVYSDPVGNDGESLIGSGLARLLQKHSAVLTGSHIHEAMMVLGLVVVSDYGWGFLSHSSSLSVSSIALAICSAILLITGTTTLLPACL